MIMVDRKESKQKAVLLSEIASNAGAIMLENGAEIYRVEDTVERIIRSKKDTRDVDVYSTFNVIILSFSYDGQVHTNVRRVKSRSNNLYYVDLVNTFSRDFVGGKYSLEEALIRLEEIKNDKGKSRARKVLGAGIAASAFSLLLQGGLEEMFVSFFVGMLAFYFADILGENGLGFFIINYLYGAVISILTLLIGKFLVDLKAPIVMISSMMAFLPGITMTNAMRDLMSGDSTSGLTGAVISVLISTALALGVGTPITIIKIWG